MVRHLAIITSEDAFEGIICPGAFKDRPRLVQTAQKYLPHLHQLLKWEVISQANAWQLVFCSSYFAVPKDANLDRAIFNGRRLSTNFLCPPSVGIADIALVNKRFSELVNPASPPDDDDSNTTPGSRRVYGFTADFRHFFHQIPVLEKLRGYFGLISDGEVFTWNSLPMGWSWSPLLAQCVGWSLLCGRFCNEEALFDEACMRDGALPAFVPLKADPGFATLYYDNVLVVGTSAKHIQAIKERLIRNMRLCGKFPTNETIKELTTFGPRDHHLEYLGCEYWLRRQRDRAGKESWTLQWRAVEKNLPKGEVWSAPTTARGTARRIGKSLYRWLLEDRPLVGNSRAERVLHLLQRLSIEGRHDWDAAFACGPEDLDLLEECRLELMRNEWISRSRGTARIFFIADASTSIGYGYFLVDTVTGSLVKVFSSTWPAGMSDMHIFYLEVFAALMGLQCARRLYPDEKTFGLLTDNTAAAGALRRGYSSSNIALRWMKEYGYLSYDAEVYTVPSAKNMADPLSRLHPTAINLPDLLSQIDELRQGRRGAEIPGALHTFTGTQRHPEPVDDIWEDLLDEIEQ